MSGTPDCDPDKYATCDAVMAVDDVELVNCQSSPEDVSCDFEDDSICHWQQDRMDDLDWELSVGMDSQDNQEGRFLKLYNSNVQPMSATIESIVLPPDQKYCFSFKYKMYGDTIGTLKMILKDQDKGGVNVVWQQTGAHANRWIKGQKQFTPTSPVSILMQGEVHGKYSPILLDQLKLQLGNCPSTSNCGFENGRCGWKEKGDIKWLVGSGQSTEGIIFTPDHDHTTKSSAGKFLYTTPSEGPGQRAILESKDWKTGTRCLNMWYMARDNDGFLQVRERYRDGVANNETESVWEMPKFYLPSWQLAQITLQDKADKTGYKTQIFFSIGTKNISMMAIDDIRIKQGACPPLDQCSFESGTCGYGNFINDKFDWIVFSASEESNFVAPPTDMSLESTEGHSFIAPLTGHKMGDSATFITPLIPRRYKCMAFW